MYIGTGAVSMWIARDYPFGSALRMGPSYFPTVLGGIMIAFGLYVLALGPRKDHEKIQGNWSIRALIVLPLIGLWVSLLKVPYRLLFPAIMAFSCIGIYSVNNSSFEIYLTAIFGLIGFMWMKLECPPAPMLLGFVLGPLMEENLRRALLISRGDPSVFLTRPISLGFIIATVLIIIIMAAPAVKARRAAITG